MENFIIDPEFRDKIPPLTADEFDRLEENIVADGEVREPIVVWNNTIIDGHNRWKVVQKHNDIPYKVKQMDFPDKWAAIVWMCKNQLGRRNLTAEQRAYIIKEEYEAGVKTSGGQAGNSNAEKRDDGNRQAVLPSSRTRAEVAKAHSISLYEVQASVEFGRGLDAADEVSPGMKTSVLSGEVKAPHSMIAEIRRVPELKRPAAVEAIRNGDMDTAKEIITGKRPERKKNEGGSAENRALKKIIDDVAGQMRDSERVVEHTMDDLLEDVTAIVEDFTSKVARSIKIRADVIKSKADKNAIVSKLDDAISAIKQMEVAINDKP